MLVDVFQPADSILPTAEAAVCVPVALGSELSFLVLLL